MPAGLATVCIEMCIVRGSWSTAVPRMLRLGRVLGCAVEPPERRVERVAQQGEGEQVVLSAHLCVRTDPNGHPEGEKGEIRLVW